MRCLIVSPVICLSIRGTNDPQKGMFHYVDSILFVPAFGRSGRAVKANQINPVGGGGEMPPPLLMPGRGLGDMSRRYMGHQVARISPKFSKNFYGKADYSEQSCEFSSSA